MKTEILARPGFSALRVQLEAGESVKAEPGAMMAHRSVRMDTGVATSSIFGSIRRLLAAESFFLNEFTGVSHGAEMYLAPGMPGDIEEYAIDGHSELFLQGGAFLACTESVTVDTKFQGLRGIFSREGMFFLRASTGDEKGTIYFNTYGGLVEMTVDRDAPLIVDNGHVVAFTKGVDYTIDRVRDLKPLLLGGEGLVLRFEGEGRVWVQTREIPALAAALVPFLPKGDKE